MKFFGWLTIAFIVLKLCGVIAWSWWLVLLPLYWGVALGLIILLSWIAGLLGLAGVVTLIDKGRSIGNLKMKKSK